MRGDQLKVTKVSQKAWQAWEKSVINTLRCSTETDVLLIDSKTFCFILLIIMGLFLVHWHLSQATGTVFYPPTSHSPDDSK